MFYSKQTGGFYDTAIHGDNMPADVVEITAEYHAALLQGQSNGRRIVADMNGHPVLADQTAQTQAETVAQYEAALDAHLDAVAKSCRYDNRITFSLRAGYTGPYQEEGVAFAQWMDACYMLSNQIKNSVLAGERAMPTIDEFISAMPGFVKP